MKVPTGIALVSEPTTPCALTAFPPASACDLFFGGKVTVKPRSPTRFRGHEIVCWNFLQKANSLQWEHCGRSMEKDCLKLQALQSLGVCWDLHSPRYVGGRYQTRMWKPVLIPADDPGSFQRFRDYFYLSPWALLCFQFSNVTNSVMPLFHINWLIILLKSPKICVCLYWYFCRDPREIVSMHYKS